jgi:hypothetical protein
MVFLWRKRRPPEPEPLFQAPKETLTRGDSIDRELERDKKERPYRIAGGVVSAFSLLAGGNPFGGFDDIDLWHGHDRYGGR